METTLTTPDVAPQMAVQVEAMPIEVVRHVLWHFGDVVLGEEPGGFVSALLTTMGRADKANFQKLAVVFEHYANGHAAVARTSGGLDLLRSRAKAAIV
jgi:hypothetical protein